MLLGEIFPRHGLLRIHEDIWSRPTSGKLRSIKQSLDIEAFFSGKRRVDGRREERRHHLELARNDALGIDIPYDGKERISHRLADIEKALKTLKREVPKDVNNQ